MKILTKAGAPSVNYADGHIYFAGVLSRDPDEKGPAGPPTCADWQEQAKKIFGKLTALAEKHHFQPENIDEMTIMVRNDAPENHELVKISYNFFFVGMEMEDRPSTTVLSALALPNASLVRIDFKVKWVAP